MAITHGDKININRDATYTVVLKNGFVCTVVNGKTKIVLNNNEYGLHFYNDGQVCTFPANLPGDDRDYNIVSILPAPLPPLPEGYAWAGGWPTLREIKSDEEYITNYPEHNGLTVAEKNYGKVLQGHKRIAVEKIKVETKPDLSQIDPEEYVDITDLFPNMYARVGIDESRYEKGVMQWAIESEAHKKSPSATMTIGEWYKERQIRHRCKRKDLPVSTSVVQNDIPKEYPIYYLYNPETKGCAKFIIRISETVRKCIGHDGKLFTGHTMGLWGLVEDNAVRNGTYKLSSKEECDKWLASLTTPVTVTPDTPKYYIHKDRRIGDGWLAYAEVSKSTITWYAFTMAPYKESQEHDNDFINRFGKSWNEVSKEEALKFYNSYTASLVKIEAKTKDNQCPQKKGCCMVEYRPIDIDVDTPQDNDEFFNETEKWWKHRNTHNIKKNAPFLIGVKYRRPIVANNSNPVKKEEEVMSTNDVVSFETAKNVAVGTAKFAGRMGWRALNYWLFEPTKEVTTKIMRAVRYVTLGTALVGGIYAYNNPESAKEFGKSLLPKISISFEKPEIFKS